MSALINRVGQTFGRLTVVERAGTAVHGEHAKWRCLCECGNCCYIRSNDLTSGKVKSCGCWNREQARNRFTKHGARHTSEYAIFVLMRQRCKNPNNHAFKDYGARGITLEWETFEQFIHDMGPRPSPHHTIDRIDNNGSYNKDNCRWATWKEQANNRRPRRRKLFLTYQGETLNLSQWAERSGFSYNAIRSRMLLGWNPERILTEPLEVHAAKLK